MLRMKLERIQCSNQLVVGIMNLLLCIFQKAPATLDINNLLIDLDGSVYSNTGFS